MPYFLISATHKSSGKTTITLGLCAAFTSRGLIIQPFKKGPDYIDPLWLTQAAQRPCHNLDFQTMTTEEIQRNVAWYSQDADLSIIEGNMAFYDGIDLEGSNSNAALAKLLKAPVILVLDTHGMTRSIAPLLLGYQAFDPEVYIAGVILNLVGGTRHEGKLRETIEHYTDIPVIGAIPRDPNIIIAERHLGLIPSYEANQAQTKINTIVNRITHQIDLSHLIKIARQAPPLPLVTREEIHSPVTLTPTVKIGIIRDAAFGFYYPGDLAALEASGAQLIFIDALHDSNLPPVDGLFIGGGFPEVYMEKLAQNHTLKQDIRNAIEQGMPVYAECGGLMYLARQLIWQDKTGDMVGALPFDTMMTTRPQGRGYVHLRETGHGLWPLRDAMAQPTVFHAHEFHHSQVINLPNHLPFAYEVLRGHGLDGQHDGIIYKNTLASYTHLRDVENNRWTQRFIKFIRQCNQQCTTLSSHPLCQME
ncbi:MAG: hydrogenobyrinic acid a,c-diamide synthase (glutamine-hydrolyzing) [Thioploca sp.]|nr:hydrogenobyrinic acid a,c-diamide synthase (glutamine-hydrolyzing) [Thioploca sp.]